jgi:hypothetical protein
MTRSQVCICQDRSIGYVRNSASLDSRRNSENPTQLWRPPRRRSGHGGALRRSDTSSNLQREREETELQSGRSCGVLQNGVGRRVTRSAGMRRPRRIWLTVAGFGGIVCRRHVGRKPRMIHKVHHEIPAKPIDVTGCRVVILATTQQARESIGCGVALYRSVRW